MSGPRYPTELAVSTQDFVASGWSEALAGATGIGYPFMHSAFSNAARAALGEGRNEHGKVLWLLSDAASMMLAPSSPNEPFKPYIEMEGRRSALPDDLSDADLEFFAGILDSVDDVWVRGRLADILWLKKRPRSVAFALTAIDSYRAIPLDTETWVSGGRECWLRALALARMLRAGAGDRLGQMEAAISSAFFAGAKKDGFLGLWLAELLKSNGLGRAEQVEIASKLEVWAREFDEAGDSYRAREYFSASADWYSAIPDDPKATEMIVATAECWAKEATARITSENPSHMVAASFYENAIQTYRTIPRAERGVHHVDERIAELVALLNDSGAKSLSEMGVIQSPSVDVTQLVEAARKSVSGKPIQDALIAFVNLHQGVDAEEQRKTVMKRMQQHPLQSLFPATVLSKDGRVIAKRPAMGFNAALTEDDETAIRAEMVRDFGLLTGIVVQAEIWPALEVILSEHRLREADFTGLASQSPIVPKDRAGLWGKALFAGYERDMVTALHLLAPQVEHMIRVHLKQAGVKTTNLDKNGIENENGMNTLMDLPQTERVFGRDTCFVLRSLFCDPFGPNLRNELAHGLLDEEACHSPYAIYAWWYALRLTFNTWWNVAHEQSEGSGGPCVGEEVEQPPIEG